MKILLILFIIHIAFITADIGPPPYARMPEPDFEKYFKFFLIFN